MVIADLSHMQLMLLCLRDVRRSRYSTATAASLSKQKIVKAASSMASSPSLLNKCGTAVNLFIASCMVPALFGHEG